MKDRSRLHRDLPSSALFQCGYLPDPDLPHCGTEATWHGFALDETMKNIVAMMTSCDEHVCEMIKAADYVHLLKHPCCIPGSEFVFPDNYCIVEWDERAEFAEALISGRS